MLSHGCLLDPMDCSMPGFLVLHCLLVFAQTHVHWVSDAVKTISSSVIPFSSCSQSFPALVSFPVNQPIASGWSFGISLSNEYSGLISFRIDWFDLPADQGALKSLLQYWSSKASILWHSAFFMVQLSHPYMTTGKAIVFISKMMSLLFNMLFRFVTAFLPRGKWWIYNLIFLKCSRIQTCHRVRQFFFFF